MTTRSLVIVESPAKCAKIESYLGPGYRCAASFGHIRELEGLRSINTGDSYKLSFDVSAGKRKQISILKRLAKECGEVVIATDDDREGEAIGWHLCVVLGLPVQTTKRIIFNEITPTALKNAIARPTILNMDLVMAQQARQAVDMLVGYMISPVLWAKVARKSKTGLSAGRCQTPALRLVYDNQKEVENNPGELAYNTIGYFTAHNLPFALERTFTEGEEVEAFLEETVNWDHVFDNGPIRKVRKSPPLPFTTSALQQMASNECRYPPKETMRLCQTLYEGGYITYMRTDSRSYSKEFLDDASAHIRSKFGERYDNTAAVGTKGADASPKKGKSKGKKKQTEEKGALAQEAHEAIRPTNVKLSKLPDSVGGKEARMYRLIWRNTLESCMTDAELDAVTCKISAPQDAFYKYISDKITFPGWLAVDGREAGTDTAVYNYLTAMKKKSGVTYSKVTAKNSLKNQKSHLTEARLVQMLEEKGIGRPSTFSSLIDKIQKRGYVKIADVPGRKVKCVDYTLVDDEMALEETTKEMGNQRNKLVMQQLGKIVLEVLVSDFNDLFDYNYTKGMETQLDAVAKGSSNYVEVCGSCHDQIVALLESAGDTGSGASRIQIDDEHTYMVGKYGPVIRKGDGKTATFIKVKKDIDLGRLRRGEYSMDELQDTSSQGRMLGKHDGKEVWLKKGQYGLYLHWGTQNKTLKGVDIAEAAITLEDVTSTLNGEGAAMLRALDKNTSVRNGKYGHYVFYKTETMRKPKFVPIKGYGGDYLSDPVETVIEWLHETQSL
jgi:DNA topoisomerase I